LRRCPLTFLQQTLSYSFAVPTYTYACKGCENVFEKRQSFSDDALTVCEQCGGTLRKVIHPVGIVFKGSGWYINDSRPSSKPVAPVTAGAKDGAASKDGAAPKESTSDSKSESSSNGETKSSGDTKSSDAAPAKPASTPASSEASPS
jgi:putative FmdB family regulatory protein